MSKLCLGVIVAAHGVRGQVKVKCFTAVPEAVAGYGELTDASGERRFKLRLVGPAKGGVVVQIAGVSDRNAAEALKGTELYVAREALPEPAADEFYHADLIGLRAEFGDGAVLGQVVAVHDYGAGDVLEVKRAAGKPVLLSFTRDVVPVVDIRGGRIVVDPPAGSLDEGGKEDR